MGAAPTADNCPWAARPAAHGHFHVLVLWLALCAAVLRVLTVGLDQLGVPIPDRM